MSVTIGTYGATGSTGWTSITPSGTWQNGFLTGAPASGTSMLLYVSSTGSDAVSSTEGSSSNPYATIAHAMTKVRGGQPDWILLKKGDTFTDDCFGSLSVSGKSSTEPIVFTSYSLTGLDSAHPRGTGTGARPLIQFVSTSSTYVATLGYAVGASVSTTNGDNIAYIGLEFYAKFRDPNVAGFLTANGATSFQATVFLSKLDWNLWEDCKISYFAYGLDYNVLPVSSSSIIYIRRNIIVDQYSTGNQSLGCYTEGMAHRTIEENLFDHNGWNKTQLASSNFIVRSHNTYDQINDKLTGGNTVSAVGSTFRGNILANSPSNDNSKIGGTITDNLMLAQPTGFGVGGDETCTSLTLQNNVSLESGDEQFSGGTSAGGWGFKLTNCNGSGIIVDSNIVAHTASASPNTNEYGFQTDADCWNWTFSNNIVYNIQTISAGAFSDQNYRNIGAVAANGVNSTKLTPSNTAGGGSATNTFDSILNGDTVAIAGLSANGIPDGDYIVTCNMFTVTGYANNGSNLIRVALNTTTGITSNDLMYFTGINGTDHFNDANGARRVTVIDGTHVDLNGLGFTDINPTWTGGGTAHQEQFIFINATFTGTYGGGATCAKKPLVASTGNKFDTGGNNTFSFPSPNPTTTFTLTGDYYVSIGSPGAYGNSTGGFLAACRAQSADSWNSSLTASAHNNYVRTRFGTVAPTARRGSAHGRSLQYGF